MKHTDPNKNNTTCKIAIIGIGVNYPGAKSSLQLWENILARRQQFREMPDIRLPLKDYYDPDPTVADKTYQKKAAVLDGYSFNWLDRKIPKSTFESTDIVHWLALDTAIQALSDARMHDMTGMLDTTGVVVGNTLTGEFTRSNHMLLRWPYVKKALQASLKKKGLQHIQDSLEVTMEQYYKSVFAPVTEDTLAGGLANTIAGRICNYLDIHGGGFIVDGACSSSLLAICNAANYLELGQMDMVIAGGVDISLDTFELIGFAKTGALTRDEMSVYDKNGKGFIPGEGCGMVVLKRMDDAVRDNNQIYAVLEGWGISSDGKGGITAPSAVGQSRALLRAYEKASFDPEKLNFIEGHGTGTTVGDKTELEGITIALNKKNAIPQRNCGVTSFKSIVGHTKAAAGVGAFIKTVMALNRRVIPPTAGLKELNPIFEDKAKTIYPVLQGQVMAPDTIMYAGVSAMGFGGINSHVVLRSGDLPFQKLQPVLDENKLLISNQSTELFLFAADDKSSLANKITESLQLIRGISYAELQDFAAFNNTSIDLKLPLRAAVVVGEPFELERKLNELLKNINTSFNEKYSAIEGNSIVVGRKKDQLKIGALFPGQGAQRINMAGKLVQRFDWAKELVENAELIFKSIGTENVLESVFRPLERVLNNAQENQWKDILKQTNIAQPAITLASLIWNKYLEKLGIKISAATGHSLGELMAFHAVGLLSEETLLKFAAFRGKIMAGCGSGTMASLVCTKEVAEKFIKMAPGYATIANINSPEQTVISGEAESIDFIIKQAETDHVGAVKLPVSAAFHSKLIGDAAKEIEKFAPLKTIAENVSNAVLVSSVTGARLGKNTSLNSYFADQCIKQVNFIDAVNTISKECDVLVEIGPGKTLAGLSENIQKNIKSFPIESRPNDDYSLNVMLANIFVMGADIKTEELYKDRLIREFVPASKKEFIRNPLERVFPDINVADEPIESNFNSGLLMQHLDFNADQLNAYMNVRGGFIKEIIQTDMKYFHPNGNSMAAVAGVKKNTLAQQAIEKPVIQNLNVSLKSTLYKKIEEVTGFPSDNFKPSMKLLDDFNLDSIKAGSLLNNIFKALGVQGKINPSNHLNSSLETIMSEIDKLVDKNEVAGNSSVFSKEEIENDVLDLLAERTGFPKSGIKPEFRLLNDLNLDSIKAGSVLAHLIKKYNLQGKVEAAAHANASINEIVSKIIEFMTKTEKKGAATHNKLDVQKFVFDQVEAKTGFPQSRITPELKLLDDLNLDSIKANSLIAGLAKHYNLLGKLEPVKFSNATLAHIIENIQSFLGSELPVEDTQTTQGTENKVSSYTVGLTVENIVINHEFNKQYLKSKNIALVCTNKSKEIAQLLQKAFPEGTSIAVLDYKQLSKTNAKIDGIFVLVPTSVAPEAIDEAVEFLSVLSNYNNGNLQFLSFIQFGDGSFNRGEDSKHKSYSCFSAMAFAASLHLERPDVKYRVMEFDPNLSAQFIVDATVNEFQSDSLFLAAGFDKKQQRRKMQYELTSEVKKENREIHLDETDVVLVTGGAKGITSECALHLARKYKCRMALVGSSAFNGEAGEIDVKLKAYSKENLIAKYFACNISDEKATDRLIDEVTKSLGKISCIVHGAGKNVPRRAENVSFEQALDEISPKLKGAYNLFNSVDKKELKGFIAFTSIIGVTGMAGNSWYAFSNEALDNFLRNIRREHNIETVSLAYSIWSEVGMGERMGSTVALARMGIGAIPPRDGINEFLKWTETKTRDQQIVIAASMGDLDTWFRKPYPKPEANRYLDKILIFEKGEKLKARSSISQKTDVYINDHNYKGSLLFPTVFGLEAMAQAVAMVAGIKRFKSVKLENISLLKPIVVPDDGETEIEINALVIEQELSSTNLVKVKVGISTEHSDFGDDHFSATFIVGGEPKKDKYTCETDTTRSLPIDPKSDLYSWLLFQGPRFQQINKVYKIGNDQALFETRNVENDTSALCFSKEKQSPLLLGSPLLRDTLLQSVQLMLTKNIVLPIGIESWEIEYPENQPLGGTVECRLTSWDGNTGFCDVIYFNDKNEVMEKIQGYKVKSMEPKDQHPTSPELNDLSSFFNQRINNKFATYESIFAEKLYLIAYKHGVEFNNLSQKDRRIIEQEVLNSHAHANHSLNGFGSDVSIQWDNKGKPGIKSGNGNISISHSNSFLLMVLGKSVQGCDLEFIDNRTQEEWQGLVNPKFINLTDRLLESDKNYNKSFTRLWGVQEACIKAFGMVPEDLIIQKIEREGVIFKAKCNSVDCHLLTFPLQLFPNVNYIVTLLVDLKSEVPSVVSKQNYDIDNIFDADLGKFITHFYTAFKDCRGFHGKTHFANIPLWMGNLREYILTPVKKKLLKDLGSGEFGMVTNDSTIRIYGEAETLDKVTGRLWITDKSDLKYSLIDLGYEWLKHTEDGKLVKIADCELSTTWVKIEDRGIVKLSPIPEYFYTYLDSHLKRDGISEENIISTEYPDLKDLGSMIYESPAIPRPSILLNCKTYHTGMYNANTVGNLYYSNYYDWQAKNIESHFYTLLPELYLKNGRSGEYICLETNVNHLQEAMPFEEIEVNMYLEQLYSKGVKLYFEYYSVGREGKRKLAYGYNILLWAQRKDEESIPVATEVPKIVIDSFGIQSGIKTEMLN